MLELSAEEKDVILRLGSNSDYEIIEHELLQKLIEKRLLYCRTSDSHLDLTALGENTYVELLKKKG